MEIHWFRVSAWWSSGRTGIAKSDSVPNAVHFAAPPEFGGLEGRWTPEDLLLSAVASCFTTTFQAVAGYSKFDYTDLEVEAEAMVNKAEKGYSIAELAIRPVLRLPRKSCGTALSIFWKKPRHCAWFQEPSRSHPGSNLAWKWGALYRWVSRCESQHGQGYTTTNLIQALSRIARGRAPVPKPQEVRILPERYDPGRI
jgi:organic hydroperoxide reductase OsmC/OhrA